MSQSYEVERLLAVLDAAAPDEARVELIEGVIRVQEFPHAGHARLVSKVRDQVHIHRGDQVMRCFTRLGLRLDAPALPAGRAQPDLVVAPKGSFRNRLEYQTTSEVTAVGEVTSRATAETDRGAKLRGYARAGIPVYLLIDRLRDEVVVYSEPEGETYGRKASAEFSKTVSLPDPLGFDLDTSEF